MTLATIFRHEEGATWLAGGVLVQAPTLRCLKDLDAVMHQAQVDAKAQVKLGIDQARSLRERARAEGYEQGRLEGVASVLGAQAIEKTLRRAIAAELAGIVERTLRTLVGAPDDPAVLRTRILHLLEAGGADTPRTQVPPPVTVHIHPQDLDVLSQALEGLPAVHIRLDEHLSIGTVRLALQWGFIESDLEVTIAQACDSLRQAVEAEADDEAQGVDPQ